MNRYLDIFLVILALLASSTYALSSLGPKSLRRRMWQSLARAVARAPSLLHLHGLARRLDAVADKAADKAAGGCGGCGTCAAEQPAAGPALPEVRVPLPKIDRRG
ncbi:MAG TPA: DUF6587 family protein [Steroidobacteraceae bacterium]